MNKAGINALKSALEEAQRRETIEKTYLDGLREKLARSGRDHEKSAQLVAALTEAIRSAESETSI